MSVDLDQKTLTLALCTPDSNGAWARRWREKTIQMTVPDLVVARAQAGKTQAPNLREIVEADGTRYAVLDFIVEVPAEKQATFEEMHTVVDFDWGVRVLVTASVVDLDGHQIGHPFFLDTGPFDGRQRLACAARLTSSRRKWPDWKSSAIASRSAIRDVSHQRKPCRSCAERSAGVGANTRPETTIWVIWRRISSWSWPAPLIAS